MVICYDTPPGWARWVVLLLVVVCGVQVGFQEKASRLHPINLNTANSGSVYGDRILEVRKSYGSAKSVDDLPAIKGIRAEEADKMRKYLSVGKPAQSKQGVTSAQAKAPPETSVGGGESGSSAKEIA